MIEELVQQCADRTGLTVDQARTALSAALSLIQKHADAAKTADLFAAIPGTSELAQAGAAMTQQKSGGLIGGMMRQVGGSSGAAMSDAMALGQKLARQGIMVSDMQAILPVAMTFVEQKTGTDQLRAVLENVPGLGPLLTAES